MRSSIGPSLLKKVLTDIGMESATIATSSIRIRRQEPEPAQLHRLTEPRVGVDGYAFRSEPRQFGFAYIVNTTTIRYLLLYYITTTILLQLLCC